MEKEIEENKIPVELERASESPCLQSPDFLTYLFGIVGFLVVAVVLVSLILKTLPVGEGDKAGVWSETPFFVGVKTDKDIYSREDKIKVTVKNNLGKPICFESCNPYWLQKKDGDWEDFTYKTCEDHYLQIKECLQPGAIKVFENPVSTYGYTMESGIYRYAVKICINCEVGGKTSGQKTIYSNEFKIIDLSGDSTSVEGKIYVIAGLQKQEVREGEEFVLDTNIQQVVEGDQIEKKVGAIKLRLLEIRDNAVLVKILADETHTGNFYPREKEEEVLLKTGSCISGYPLVMDVGYDYCFEYKIKEGERRLHWHVIEESTMPKP